MCATDLCLIKIILIIFSLVVSLSSENAFINEENHIINQLPR